MRTIVSFLIALLLSVPLSASQKLAIEFDSPRLQLAVVQAIRKLQEPRCEAFFFAHWGFKSVDLIEKLGVRFTLAEGTNDWPEPESLGYGAYHKCGLDNRRIVWSFNFITKAPMSALIEIVIHELSHVADCEYGNPFTKQEIEAGYFAAGPCFSKYYSSSLIHLEPQEDKSDEPE